MTGFEARNSGSLVELQAARAIVAAVMAKTAGRCKDMDLRRVTIKAPNKP
jgi:hypothetical protein